MLASLLARLPNSMRNIRPFVPMLVIGVAGLVFLYFYNPQDIPFFPRCPFYALTGYKCPGCGTLRAIHALLHFRIAEAFNLNPFMLLSIPVMAGMLISRRFAFSVAVGKMILGLTLLYWLVRNIV